MTVLGIESATLVCGAALAADGRVLSDRWVEERNVHAERILSLVDGAVGAAGLGAVDAIAVSAGPGSFTGLRVGVSVAKALAFAVGRPLVAVGTLEAIAVRTARRCDAGRLIVPVLDARQGEVYYQVFLREGGCVPRTEPEAGSLTDLLARLAGEDVLLTGEAAGKVAEASHGTLRCAERSVARSSAGTIALLGEGMARDGRTVDAAALEPRYIKEFFLKTPHT